MTLLRAVSIVALAFTLIANAKDPVAICLTGRVVTNFPSYGEAFINATNLAISQKNMEKSVIVRKYFYDNRPLSPISAYKKMVKDDCAAIIGFEYLSDLLLIIKNQKNTKIPIFSSYSSTLDKNNFPRNIFIFMPSYRFLSSKMIEFANKKFGRLNNVLLITEINRDSMKQYRQAYIEEFKKEHIQYETFEILENDKNLIDKLKRFIRKKEKFDYVFILSGAVASSKIVDTLNDNKIVFFGTENYGSSRAQSFYIGLLNKNVNSYFIRNFDPIEASSILKKYEQLYENEFGKKPLSISAYTYDAARIILNSVERNDNVKINNILNIDYVGASGIKIENGIFYRSSEYIILKVTKNGYQHVESITN